MDRPSDRRSNNPEQVERWYHQASPREKQEFDQVFDSLDRYKSTMEDDNDTLPYLPPKPSESFTRLRLNKQSRSNKGIASVSSYSSPSPRFASPLRYSNDRGNLSGSVNPPRSPPSKVGSVMWGNETPLARKGPFHLTSYR